MTAVDAARPAATQTTDAPYVGLTHYTEQNADLFFGRDAEASVIVGNLRASRLTLLYAESGVGKSSVLRAAVAARLRGIAVQDKAKRGSPRFVPVVFSAWSADPVAGLIDEIEKAIRPFLPDNADIVLPRDRLENAIEAATSALDLTLLLILDQFEEHFLYRSQQNGREPFADQLARCINRSDLRVNVLIAIREDSYAGLGDLFSGRIGNVYANFVHLDYLDREGAREAIEKPIERLNEGRPADERFEPPETDLVDAVLDGVSRGARHRTDADGRDPSDTVRSEAEANQIETTYLQLVMERLWDEEAAAGSRVLRHETLERLGGAATIIDEHLDRELDALAPDEQDTAASIFTFLVTRAGTKIALTAKDLSELSHLPETQIDPILRQLAAESHILRPVDLRDPGRGRAYEIFHDALADPIVEWRQAKLAERLAEAERREARERMRKRMAIAALAVVIAAALGAALVGFLHERSSAERRKKETQSLRSVERTDQISSIIGPTLPALAGLESYRLSPTLEARKEILDVLQASAGLPKTAFGHDDQVSSVAWVDPTTLASGSIDDTIKLWNRSGAPLKTLQTAGDVNHIAVGRGRGGTLLAAAESDGRVELWRVARPAGGNRLETEPLKVKGKALASQNPNGAEAVAFGRVGSNVILATGGNDCRIALWNVTNAGAPRPAGAIDVDDCGSSVNALAFSSDGRLASATDTSVQEWKLEPAGPDAYRLRLRRTPLSDNSGATSVAWDPDGNLAAGIDFTNQSGVRLWSSGRSSPSRFFATTDTVEAVAFAEGGKTLVSGGDDWNITTWDVRTGRPFGPPRLQATNESVTAIAVSPDGTVIASGGDTNSVKIWPLRVNEPLATTIGAIAGRRPVTIWDLGFGSGGLVAAAADTRGTYVWKTEAGAASGLSAPTHIPHTDAALALAFHGTTLVTTDGAFFVVWDTGPSCTTMPKDACRLARVEVPHDGYWIWSVALDRGGTMLATGLADGNVDLWDLSRPKRPIHLGGVTEAKGIRQVAFSPTQDILAAGGNDKTLRLWDVSSPRDPEPLGVARGSTEVSSVAFAPSGRLLATGGENNRVALWSVDARKGAVRRPEKLEQSNTINSLSFSHDGKVLAAGDQNGATCLYDVATLLRIGSCLQGHYSSGSDVGTVNAVRFTPDGRTLLSAGTGNPVIAWDSILWSLGRDKQTLQRFEDIVCRLEFRNLTPDEWKQIFAFTRFAHDPRATCPRLR